MPPTPSGQHRDNDVRHLGYLRHQPKHFAPRDFDNPGWPGRAHRHRPVAAAQERDLRHELAGPEGGRRKALAGERVHHLDFTLLDIGEAIDWLSGTGEKRASLILDDGTGFP